jgi:hypothetical protein
MRQIEEADKFELVLDIKALVALALADELIEGGDVPLLAHRRLAATSDTSPLLGAELTRRRRLISADIAPNRTSERSAI